MRFAKMHGCGNDYVIVEEAEIKKTNLKNNMNELVKMICERRRGIGSDGIIIIGQSDIADISMKMYNADGSVGKMCGNGIRCLAKYAFENKITIKTAFSVETDAGIKNVKLRFNNLFVGSVRVDMGSPVIKETGMKYMYDGKMYIITNVDMGNPHAVIFVDDVDSAPVCAVGNHLCSHPSFPEGVNTEFVTIVDSNNIRLRVWERGSGETMACGTGACACVVACVEKYSTDKCINVHMPGGNLLIEYNTKENVVYMEGEAVLVYEGIINI
ncbi:MAG: diaminopimelate epimerase [Lachnospiraceae bacterium]|nr:diaminopimelate epimerase [Lachnospiraceae bacterium]